MVNYGVSRGCETCKKRRKKCDEARPSCQRCLKSRRVCPGYKDDGMLVFRHYQPVDNPSPLQLDRWSPTTDVLLEEVALDIFLDGFVVQSQDRRQSRGFLDGMHSLLADAAPACTLISAVRVITLASIANRTRWHSLLETAQKQYGQLLIDFTTSLSREQTRISSKDFLTAVLLGLYELIMSNHASPAKYLVHIQGIHSILRQGIHLLHHKPTVQLYLPGAGLILKQAGTSDETGRGVFSPPLNDKPRRSLDDIIIKMSPLTALAEQLLANPYSSIEELFQLQQDLQALEGDIMHWDTDRPTSWAPELVGHVRDETIEDSSYRCPGPVYKYLDQYVAAAWTSWRSICVLYLDHLSCLAHALGQEVLDGHRAKIHHLVAELKASIPYHLSRDLGMYVRRPDAETTPNTPQRIVGGLLLLHPLYVVARCTTVTVSDREYFVRILRWIGSEMGISQATVLADYLRPNMQGPSATQNSAVSFMDVLEGHFLISASMMLEPS
ncbi:hypothetical protein LCI18_003636 [Fusarium solani-melongenae]|uniref:Uncharacterized protein n=1 Tax=Fusarium solani subsp. cucurbitae TaxID=2747967 RepID=A0ACD3YUX6_FUSSC|nr:hypothetical protein LCI18_003636 [Fusarium solani-melongenae]